MDLKDAMSMGQELAEHEDIARKSKILLKKIKSYQDSMTSVEKVHFCYQFVSCSISCANFHELIELFCLFLFVCSVRNQ